MRYTLVGVDGNAYAIMGYTARAMKDCGLRDEVAKMQEEATSGDYYHLIAVCDGYIDRCNETIGATDEEDEEEEDY